ncbi:MAG: hypothetical protein K0V04_18850 [Deltaproteobacteria bacterium]|nr:hypothetical protein [Deltaproteobacteria bacterium]
MASGSGGVSVRAGPSARRDGKRARLRQAQRRQLRRRTRDDEPEPLAWDGARLCGECGRLGWPRTHLATPHRRGPAEADVAARTQAEPCVHCGESNTILLGHESTALALRAVEQQQHHGRDGLPTAVRLGLLGAAAGGVLGLTTMGGAVGVGLVGGLTALCGVLIGIRHEATFRPPPAVLPARWAMALAPEGPVTSKVGGVAVPEGEPLIAPLSGRTCLAYEVGARRDDDGDAPPATWALLEQRVTAARVEAQTVEPATTHLVLPRERWAQLEWSALDERAALFLRRRGFGPLDDGLWLFEAVVEPGQPVDLERCEGGSLLRSRGKQAALPPSTR